MQHEAYLLSLIRYIALNPVRAGLVTSPEQWPWSSFRCTAGLAPNPGFLRPESLLASFGDAPAATLRERYLRHVLAGKRLEDEAYKRFRARQRIVGDRAFRQQVRQVIASSELATVVVAPAVPAELH